MIDLVYIDDVVWYSIIVIKSLGIKPVIKSAKEKWLTAVSWEVGIIQKDEVAKSFLISDHLCCELSITRSESLSKVWSLIFLSVSIEWWQNHKWNHVSFEVLHLQQYHEAL